MQYLGGKAKVGKAVATIIAPNGRLYYEPFCGALGVMRHIGYGVAADSDPEIIALWKAVQSGWQPPSEVSREEYYAIKADTSAPPELRAFVKHGCSFGGKAWAGYAAGFQNGAKRSYAQSACNVIGKIARNIRGVEFVCSDYRALSIQDGSVVYCDPPYHGTTAIKGEFDSAEFWSWARALSRRCILFVSEYQAPPDWCEVWSQEIPDGIRQGKNAQKKRSVERLFARRVFPPWL